MPGKIGATIGGGGAGVYFGTSQSNLVAGDFGTVGGGGGNAARSLATTIAGGVNNLIEEFGAYSVIGGGFANVVGTNAQYATIGGGLQNRVGRLSFDAMIGGGALNSIGAQAYDVTIGGGLENAVEDDAWYSSIGGGNSNRIARGSQAATLAGGQENRIGTNSGSATISGGVGNAIDSSSGRSAIGGGFANIIQSQATGATISGGTSNTIQTLATSAAIGGGQLNSIQSLARNATIPGGFSNSVAGPFGFAAGRRAKANHPGAFVWADSTDADFTSMTTNQFRIRAGGGAEIVGGSNQPAFHYTGTRTGGFSTAVGLAENLNATGQSAPALRIVNAGGNSIDGALSVSAGGTGYIAKFGNASTFVADLATNGTFSAMTFNPTSDRNAKENFSRVDARAILDKVATLPITRWNFKINNGSEHLGPMAQDFHAAFGLNGEDDKHIATVDADGVALAAIQGLNQKVEEQRDELKQKQTEITELKARLEKLERMLNEMSGGAR
jgi:hypothetical protein